MSLSRRLFSLCTLLCMGILIAFSQSVHSQQGSTITAPHVRIRFLTATLVRLEYSPDDHFVDAATAVVQKRDWHQPKVTVEESDGWIVASTGRMTLRYHPDSNPLSAGNLRITWNNGTAESSWSPGQHDAENLGGIQRSLDGLRRGRIPEESAGILSRGGYFLLDDSETPLWNKKAEWIEPRTETGNQDWYLFAYGRNYQHVLKEYAELCGNIPMIPRYTLGTWITDLNYEYLPGSDFVEKYHYTDEQVKDLVLRFKDFGLPLDVLVLDFAWHKYGWKGSYDWSPIFPHPKQFLDWAHGEGLRVTLNDHPGYSHEGVLSDMDSRAETVRMALNIKPPLKPSVSIDLAPGWKFQTDRDTVGVKESWFGLQFDDRQWKVMRGGSIWENQGFPDYDGFAWYRKQISIPAKDLRQPLYCIFGGVDDEYDLYVNGTLAGHHGAPGSSVYSSLTSTDISKYVHAGDNLIALRVNDWGGGGGISAGPVLLSDELPAKGIHFNLADKHQATVFMDVLHAPLIDQGIAFWWVDGGSGSCNMKGLNSQMWTNRVFYDFTQKETNLRGFIFSRYGGWGSHRYPSFFTGDTYSQWEVLAYEVPFTARGANLLMPYVTHDLGGFIGPHVPFDLWARWMEFGVFSPFVRLHSAHENPRDGNVRMPWTYGDAGVELARTYFRLRYRLIPYIYTYCRTATDDAVGLVRPLYLEYPSLEEAYDHPYEYCFGKELLVSPVVDSTGIKNTYLPPGEWIDYFNGKRYEGGQVLHQEVPVDQIPVFVRAGSIIPAQTDRNYSDEGPLDTLVVDVYGPQPGQFDLYEDDGLSLEYRSGKFARTMMSFSTPASHKVRLTVNATSGEFTGQVPARAYIVRFHGLSNPRSVSVDGRPLPPGTRAAWKWEPNRAVLTVSINSRNIRKSFQIDILTDEG